MKARRREKQLARRKETQELGRCIAYQLYRTIEHLFPNLFDWMRHIEDCRGKSEYELTELIVACLAMYLFKTGSRNELNNLREDAKFRKNYSKLFKLRLPHADTVDRVMRWLPEKALEDLKCRMIQALLNRKALHKYRFGKWFVLAIDGTGIVSFDKKHCEHCLHRTSKKGKITWFHNVSEAKLITPNGFALSVGTVWIENPTGEYDKQDCERKAFIRLAANLKRDYPRLPICLTADGLYPYQGFFDICKEHGWRYILTFKDGCLPSVWEEVNALAPLMEGNRRRETLIAGKQKIQRDYRWVTDIDYNGHTVHWCECVETLLPSESKHETKEQHRFVHLSDIRPEYQTVLSISETGRLRWKIENEGFNTQKNQGYALQHKYSRNSYRALKNYYQCLQIAHIINELLVLSTTFQTLLTGKMTIKHLWKRLESLFTDGDLDENELKAISARSYQIRFVT